MRWRLDVAFVGHERASHTEPILNGALGIRSHRAAALPTDAGRRQPLEIESIWATYG
jgi:hypothetical protein